ncbi:MAG: undecaprenyl phosphate translocase family protein [Phycisphaerales bacterium JB059]
MSNPETAPETPGSRFSAGLGARAAAGGALMGLANLVPGISGGTMLVAAGVYRAFIDAISDVTRLRFRATSVLLLGVVVGSALVAIVGLSSVISAGLTSYRWGMYALFIGLTLGGAPVLIRMIRPFHPSAWVGLVAGALVMVGLVALQSGGEGGGAGRSGVVMLLLAGAAGASAMILPGVSGAYLLLLLGQYRPIIEAIRAFKDALTSGDVQGAMDQMGVLLPVGIGVVVGVVLVSNALRVVLHRFEKATLGVLLGLLLAAPLGLYPFKKGVAPEIGDSIRGEVVTPETVDEIDPKDWPERRFTPSAGQIAGAAGLIALGFVGTLGVSRLGRGKNDQAD